MRTAAVALLGFMLAGCASAARTEPRSPVNAAPISRWQDSAEGGNAEAVADESAPEDAMSAYLLEAASLLSDDSPIVDGDPPAQPAESASLGEFEPEVVHRAKIEMARAALVDENQNKERVDLAEELQRELAALQASQMSKSRVKHGAPAKKQP